MLVDCISCERMAEAETEIKNLKGLTSGMDTKVDQLMIDFAKAKNALILLNIISPVAVGLIVFLVTKGSGH